MVTGPGLWLVSQLLLLIYFKIDNGANTCGIDFHFDNKNEDEDEDKDEDSLLAVFRMVIISGISALKRLANCSSSNEETGNDSNSIINDDEPRDDTYFEIKLLEELFISEFEVVSEEGR